MRQERHDETLTSPESRSTTCNSFQNLQTRNAANLGRRAKSTRSLMSVVVCFVLCWLSYNVQLFVEIFHKDISEYVTKLSALLALGNILFNPFLYGLLNPQFAPVSRDLDNRMFQIHLYCKMYKTL